MKDIPIKRNGRGMKKNKTAVFSLSRGAWPLSLLFPPSSDHCFAPLLPFTTPPPHPPLRRPLPGCCVICGSFVFGVLTSSAAPFALLWPPREQLANYSCWLSLLRRSHTLGFHPPTAPATPPPTSCTCSLYSWKPRVRAAATLSSLGNDALARKQHGEWHNNKAPPPRLARPWDCLVGILSPWLPTCIRLCCSYLLFYGGPSFVFTETTRRPFFFFFAANFARCLWVLTFRCRVPLP